MEIPRITLSSHKPVQEFLDQLLDIGFDPDTLDFGITDDGMLDGIISISLRDFAMTVVRPGLRVPDRSTFGAITVFYDQRVYSTIVMTWDEIFHRIMYHLVMAKKEYRMRPRLSESEIEIGYDCEKRFHIGSLRFRGLSDDTWPMKLHYLMPDQVKDFGDFLENLGVLDYMTPLERNISLGRVPGPNLDDDYIRVSMSCRPNEVEKPLWIISEADRLKCGVSTHWIKPSNFGRFLSVIGSISKDRIHEISYWENCLVNYVGLRGQEKIYFDIIEIHLPKSLGGGSMKANWSTFYQEVGRLISEIPGVLDKKVNLIYTHSSSSYRKVPEVDRIIGNEQRASETFLLLGGSDGGRYTIVPVQPDYPYNWIDQLDPETIKVYDSLGLLFMFHGC